MTTPQHPTSTEADIEANPLAAFCFSASLVIQDGIEHARKDDPHRLAALPKEFDGGKARFRLVADYLANGQIRIATEAFGTKDGEEYAVELFSTLVQGPTGTKGH